MVVGRGLMPMEEATHTSLIDIHNGDGICFFTKQGNLAGFRIDRIDEKRIYPNKMQRLEMGTRLYRNYDKAFSQILNKSSANRKISVEMAFIQENELIRLIVRDEDNNEATAIKEVFFNPTRNPLLTKEQIRRHLSSTGNTPYRVAKLIIDPQQPGFLPVSLLNSIRREVLETLTRVRLEKHFRQIVPLIANNAPYPEKKLDYRANVFNVKARQFYERHGAKVIEPAFEALSGTVGKTVMTTRYCIRYQLNLCLRENKPDHHIEGPLRITDGRHIYRLEFDCRQCRMLVILEKS